MRANVLWKKNLTSCCENEGRKVRRVVYNGGGDDCDILFVDIDGIVWLFRWDEVRVHGNWDPAVSGPDVTCNPNINNYHEKPINRRGITV
jgi:hypothetical protein